MKIAIISKSDQTGGGASRVANGLTKLLNTEYTTTFEAHHWVGLPGPNADWYTHKLHGGRWLSLAQGLFSLFSRNIGIPDFLTPELFFHLVKKPFDYDIYHLHDITYTFSPFAVNWLSQNKPTIWTLHDCSPFTGGCIYPLSCNQFETNCTKCPQISELPVKSPIDLTYFIQSYKKHILSKRPIYVISPSKWIINEAYKATTFRIPPVVIPNYVDSNIFRPHNKLNVRRLLNLPNDRLIVLLTATSLNDKRKGLHASLSALKEIQISNKIFILAIGKVEKNAQLLFSGFEHYHTGYIYNDELLSLYYSAADFFLFPSTADNFPTTILETMACGTPAISFSTGGIPEIIDHNQTGWLTTPGNIHGLVEGLNYGISHPEAVSKWRLEGIKKTSKIFTKEKFLAAHIEVYKNALIDNPLLNK